MQDNPFRSPPSYLTTLAETLQRVIANGYSPIPVRQGEKRPLIRNWQLACKEVAPLDHQARWLKEHPGAGLGIAMRGLVVVDIDYLDAAQADQAGELVERMLGTTPLLRIGRAPKRHFFYRRHKFVRTRHLEGVDLLGDGSFSVAFNIHPDTGQPYTWPRRSPLDTPLAELPVAEPRMLRALMAKLAGEHGRPEPGRRSNTLPGSQTLPDDLRDQILYKAVQEIFRQGERDANELARRAFALFLTRANLTRPRTRDGRPWGVEHALEKAHSVLRTQRAAPNVQASIWPDERKRNFRDAINAACASGQLPRLSAAVSHRMLQYIGSTGACWVSIARLASECGRHERNVQRARELLVCGGYWVRRHDEASRYVLYLPNPAVVGE
jgi:hypothetical protein